MINFSKLSATLVCLVFLPSCMHQIYKDNLSKISIGMTKQQVLSCLGQPYVKRGAMADQKSGNILEAWEYQVFQPWQGTRTYFVYFINDKLIQYGQPNDFQDPANHVQEFRVR